MVDKPNSMPSGQKLSNNIQKNIDLQSKFNRELQKTLELSNNILKSMNLPTIGGDGGGGGGAGSLTTRGAFTNAGKVISRIGATALGVASGAAQALPGLQDVLQTQLLTSQARFSGMANVSPTIQAAMRGGQVTSTTDMIQAVAAGSAGGLLPSLPGYGNVLTGVSQISNLTGDAGSAMRATMGLNSAKSVNTMRMFGINVRNAEGGMNDPAAIFKQVYNFASQQSGGKLTPKDVAIGLQPGNGLSNFLDAAAGGNQDLRNALQLAAQQFAKGGDLTRSSTTATGITTAAQSAQSDFFAGKFNTEVAAAPAMSKGFIEGADLLTKWNKSLAETLETSKFANAAVKQLAKAEMIAADNIGKAGLSVISVLAASGIAGGAYAGIKGLLGKFGARATTAAGVATKGPKNPALMALLFAGALSAPGVIERFSGGSDDGVISGLNPGSSGLGLDASVSGPTASSNSVPAGSAAVTIASTQLGVPYSWGGGSNSGPTVGRGSGSKTVGFDCSSFVKFVMAKLGVILPRTSQEQQKCGTQIDPKDAQPGDLLFWERPATHVAIYVGNGLMIQAPRTGDVVKKSAVNLKTVTSCSRVLSGKTGTASVGNILNSAGGYKGSSNYGVEGFSAQVETTDLRGNTPQDAMSGGVSSSSGLGLGGEASSIYTPTSSTNDSHRYMFINSKTGILEASAGGQSVINYGGVTIPINIPQGAKIDEKELSKLIANQIKNIGINVRMATK